MESGKLFNENPPVADQLRCGGRLRVQVVDGFPEDEKVFHPSKWNFRRTVIRKFFGTAGMKWEETKKLSNQKFRNESQMSKYSSKVKWERLKGFVMWQPLLPLPPPPLLLKPPKLPKPPQTKFLVYIIWWNFFSARSRKMWWKQKPKLVSKLLRRRKLQNLRLFQILSAGGKLGLQRA